MKTRRLWIATVMTCVSVASLCVGASPAEAAAAKVEILGSVECPSGKAVQGVWVESSGGGSRWADWTAYPKTPTIARFYATFSANLPTKLTLRVGCGGWGPTDQASSVTVKNPGQRVLWNIGCNGNGTCSDYPMEDNKPAAPATNWFDKSECTARAADFWKQMTGRYPNWRGADGRTGDAHQWDERAEATGWKRRSWPRPDSLVVWQGNMTRSGLGHVGYVKDVRVHSGKLQILVHDRNWNNDGKDRTAWVDFTSGMGFILAPPRLVQI